MASADVNILSAFDYLRRIRGELEGHNKGEFETMLTKAGLQFREKDGLYSISCDRTVSPPNFQWRRFANTTIELDERCLPSIIACGSPEVFYVPSFDMAKVLDDAANGLYRIEPILFGTVCRLYHYRGKWCVGTKRRADATGITFRKESLGFMNAFMEALEGSLRGIDVGTFWSKLDVEKTYGLLLHHRSLHIFSYKEFKFRIWHISTIENKSGNLIHGVKIGLPHPKRLIVCPNKENVKELCERMTMSLRSSPVETAMKGSLPSSPSSSSSSLPATVVKESSSSSSSSSS